MSSPSSRHREHECEASIVLPHTAETSPRAFRGTELHRFLAKAAEVGRDDALMEVSEQWREAARAIDFSLFPPMDQSTGIAEVAIAWDPNTGESRELGRGLSHAEVQRLKRPGEHAGVIDWLALADDAVVIIDWKFGYASVPRAEVNLQLGSYATMACPLYGKAKAIVGIGRVLDNGEPWFNVHTLDEMAVESAGAQLRRHLRRVEALLSRVEAAPVPHEGEHCRYCPAFAACPAKVALLLAAVGDGDASVFHVEPSPMTPEVAGRLWEKLELARALVARLQKNVSDFARQQRVPLPNGNVLGLVQGSERDINVERFEAWREASNDSAFASVIETKKTATLGRLEKALKATLPPKAKLAPAMRLLETALEKTGALRRFAYEKVDEVKPDSARLVPLKEPPSIEEALRGSLLPEVT